MTVDSLFLRLIAERSKNNGGSQQFNGREGETATLLFGLSVSLTLRGGGFAPRHLNR
jgi:hypothetical protein